MNILNRFMTYFLTLCNFSGNHTIYAHVHVRIHNCQRADLVHLKNVIVLKKYKSSEFQVAFKLPKGASLAPTGF